MTTASEMQVKVDKFEVNMDRLNSIVNGSTTTTVITDSGIVPSIAKLVNELSNEIDGAINTTYSNISLLNQETETAISNLSGQISHAVNSVSWYNNRGAWQATTSYLVNDLFVVSGVFYLVVTAFTSTTSSATDIANGKVIIHQPKDWVQLVGSASLLRNFEPSYGNQVIYLSGHTVAGKGGGSFIHVSGSTSADDDKTVFVTTGNKRWILCEEVTRNPYRPSFSAVRLQNQVISNDVVTKVACNTEEFDSDGYYNTSNYRFTPLVAGWYQVSTTANFLSSGSSNQRSVIFIYKNGSYHWSVSDPQYANFNSDISGSKLIYLNGTTDYIEMFALLGGSGANTILLASFSALYVGNF